MFLLVNTKEEEAKVKRIQGITYIYEHPKHACKVKKKGIRSIQKRRNQSKEDPRDSPHP